MKHVQPTPAPLFEPECGKVRVDHPDTAHAAASHAVTFSAKQRRAVLDYIASCGETGSTDEQGIEATGINPSAWRPRRIECVESGLVRDSGHTRRTRAGRAAICWVATRSPA